MMAGNPNWWSINSMHPQSHQFLYGSDNSSPSNHHQNQDFPAKSWSQFLIGGEEERFGGNLFQQQKKLENWEDQVLNLNPTFRVPIVDVKQEVAQSSNCQLYHHEDHDQFHPNKLSSNSWIHDNHNQLLQVSPPTSCITSILNFSGCKAAAAVATAEVAQGKNQHLHNQEHSSECNSTNSGGVTKKARVQQSSAQPALKVRKEKLGDRITALHQLVSPFGKTDTASVLSEAIGYIRFLQGQIEALSSPYMRNGSTVHQQHSAQERNNCLFTEDQSGQFLTHDHMGMEGRAPSKQDSQSRGGVKDLRSRGLCLVPISCTQNVANDNGADYWAPAALGGGF